VQHYWSLSLEEQFYLVWPLLLVAGIVVCRRLRVTPVATPLLVAAASLALGIYLTQVSQPWAFYSLATRAWELAVGGALGMVAVRGVLSPRRALTIQLICLAALAYSFYAMRGDSWPGVAAVVPVAATAGLLLAGRQGASPLTKLFASPIPLTIGQHSYGLYLWHWPLLLFLRAEVPRTRGWLGATVAVVALSCVLAWVSARFVEGPIRHSSALAARPAQSLAMGAGLVALVVASTYAIGIPDRLDAGTPAPDPDPVVENATGFVPSDLVPSLTAARDDRPLVDRDDCHLDRGERTTSASCVYGDPDGAVTVVLFGDSHAQQWFTAFDEAARERGWRLVSLTKSACSSFGHRTKWRDDQDECDGFRDDALARIAAEEADLVVLANRSDTTFPEQAGGVDRWRQTLVSTLEDIEASGARTLVLGDNPVSVDPVPSCLSSALSRTATCGADPNEDTLLEILAVQAELAGPPARHYADVRPLRCSADECPPVMGRVLVWRDDDHVTDTFARARSDAMGDLVAGALGDGR
jgi:hypothetical protein